MTGYLFPAPPGSHISKEEGDPVAQDRVRQLAEDLVTTSRCTRTKKAACKVHVVADAIVQALERSARSKEGLRGLLGSLQVRAGHRLAEIEKEL